MKLKLYVGRSPSNLKWWWEIAPPGRTRVQDDEDGILAYGVCIETWSEAMARGLAALDEKQGYAAVRP